MYHLEQYLKDFGIKSTEHKLFFLVVPFSTDSLLTRTAVDCMHRIPESKKIFIKKDM